MGKSPQRGAQPASIEEFGKVGFEIRTFDTNRNEPWRTAVIGGDPKPIFGLWYAKRRYASWYAPKTYILNAHLSIEHSPPILGKSPNGAASSL